MRKNASVTFSRNVIRQSLVRTIRPKGPSGSAGLCRPRFSFFSLQLSKNRHRHKRCRWALPLLPSGPTEVAHAALLDFVNKGELLCRQRRRRPRCVAYIGGTPSNCQHRFSPFLNFLRRPPHHHTASPNVPNNQPEKSNLNNKISIALEAAFALYTRGENERLSPGNVGSGRLR